MTDQDDERLRVLDYVERFSDILVASGLQRMSARVFSYVLTDDADTYTAAELADGLDISLAAVSGAVRDLTTMGLLIKSRRHGTRADVYMLNDEDIWGAIMLDRTPIIRRYQALAREGVDTLPPGPGRERLRQTGEFMAFWLAQVEGMAERWSRMLERRRAGGQGPDAQA